MKLPQATGAEPLEVKMTPMIDVVFLLLIFFLWTSSFEEPEFDLPSSLAQAAGGNMESEAPDPPSVEIFDEIVVRLLIQDGLVVRRFNGQPVGDIGELRQRLEQVLALGVQPPVIVDPADEVVMADAIEAYDIARAAGADRVLFAARQSSSTP